MKRLFVLVTAGVAVVLVVIAGLALARRDGPASAAQDTETVPTAAEVAPRPLAAGANGTSANHSMSSMSTRSTTTSPLVLTFPFSEETNHIVEGSPEQDEPYRENWTGAPSLQTLKTRSDSAASAAIAKDAPAKPETSDPQSRLADSTDGPTYVWQDGDQTLEVTLLLDVTVGEDGAFVRQDGDSTATGKGGDDGGSGGGTPVFRSHTGTLMTLPGGVVLALDPDWSQAEIDAFFEGNEITADLVSPMELFHNWFFVETEPGLPSLTVANTLAGQDGVVFSIPNWWTPSVTR